MKKLSIIIPVYNEEKTILKVLRKVNSVNIPLAKEIVVVNDGSQDNTETILKKHKKLYTTFISKPNGGKGSAVRKGLEASTGDLVLIQDADLEYNPDEYPVLLKPILARRTKVVYGSRFKKTQDPGQRWGIPTHYIGNRLLSLTLSILFFRWIEDMETCYKCFTRDVLEQLDLTENDFRIEPQITTQIIKLGYRIKEVPSAIITGRLSKVKKLIGVMVSRH